MTTRYFDIHLRGRAVGHIEAQVMDIPDGVRKALEDEYPETFGDILLLPEVLGEVPELADRYSHGEVMIAVEVPEVEAHPEDISEDSELLYILERWAPCLTIRYPCECPPVSDGTHPECTVVQETYPTWGEAMKDAEARWEALPEDIRDRVMRRDGAGFRLTRGTCGPTVRDWSEKYIKAKVLMPRNRAGVRLARWNPEDDWKHICNVLVHVPKEKEWVIGHPATTDGFLEEVSDKLRRKLTNTLNRCNPATRIRLVEHGRTIGLDPKEESPFDYDLLRPIESIEEFIPHLPSITFGNEWIGGRMFFVDDGELDRALEANWDWMVAMGKVSVCRLESTMRMWPTMFENTTFGDVWTWEHGY